MIPRLSVGANLITAMFTTFIIGFMAATAVSDKFEYVRGIVCLEQDEFVYLRSLLVVQRLVGGLLGLILILIVEAMLFILRESRAQARTSG